jgi:2-aminoadipate transaminase
MIKYDGFLSRAGERMQQSAIRQMGTVAAQRPDLISFAPGYPSPDTFAGDAYRDIAASVLAGTDATALQYGPTRGYGPLLDTFGGLLASRGIAATPTELLVTTGSQQGLDLVARVLVDPGDVVLVELPSYTGAITAFRNVQAALVGVKQAADGVDLEHLDATLLQLRAEGRRVKFLYVVPNFQNPTGLLIGRAKRAQLLEWAARRDVLIVEDDPYGALYFEGTTPSDTRPIKADDREGRVIYLSSFSKTLAPAFRTAWVTAPAALAGRFETAKQALDLCTGNYDQRMVYEACRRGVLEKQLPLLRAHYQQKCRIMEQALRATLGQVVQWTEPRGGFFLWVALPERVDTTRLLQRAVSHGVIFVAGGAFFVDGTGQHTLRLSFSLPSHERIVEGVQRLAAAVSEEVAAAPPAAVPAAYSS